MAKVDEIKMTVDGVDYKHNINVGKAGQFKCTIDSLVAQKLGLTSGFLYSDTLQGLKNMVTPAYHKYLESKKIESVWIKIIYKARGVYTLKEGGVDEGVLFGRNGNKFYDDTSFAKFDSLTFDYEVFIKEETSLDTTIWYRAKKGSDYHFFREEENDKEPEKWYKDGQTYNIGEGDGTFIPYTKQAHETLDKAQEGIRKISEILFNVCSQDEDTLIGLLNSGKLLPHNSNE
jgi:hypothetical protein